MSCKINIIWIFDIHIFLVRCTCKIVIQSQPNNQTPTLYFLIALFHYTVILFSINFHEKIQVDDIYEIMNIQMGKSIFYNKGNVSFLVSSVGKSLG